MLELGDELDMDVFFFWLFLEKNLESSSSSSRQDLSKLRNYC
jgi:hypothetical protein